MGQPYEAIRLNGVPWGHVAVSNPIDAYRADPMEFYGSTGLRNSPLEPYGPPWGPFNSQLAFLCRPNKYGLVTFLSDRRNRRAGATQTVTLNLTAVRSDKNKKLFSKKITEN